MEQEADELIGSQICYRIYQQYTSKGVSTKKNKRPQNTMDYYSIGYNESFEKNYNI